MAILILFNKPFGVLCQFTDQDGCPTLAEYITTANVYPAGRLDKHSEGLLLLTDNGKVQQNITHPRFKLDKHYWVQVEGEISDISIKQLVQGIKLKDGYTKPSNVTRIVEPKNLWARKPPIRFRKTISTQWLNVILREGRNRQIRRMTAAVNHPTLRIIRHRIGPWCLDHLKPGDYVRINAEKIYKLLENYNC